MLRSGDLVAERYRLAAFIGSGGMGTVWQAHDISDERTVALKRPHTGCGEAQRRQLQEEARVAHLVDHPNAVAVYEVAPTECWLVMEYVPAPSLAEVIERDGPLGAGRAAAIGAQIAAALAAAHSAGVVHRDVTPSNVLVGENDAVKVTDFGISVWREATITESGKVSGKPGYLAPEVADGERATAASDVFSLGATIFAAVEGGPPFGTGDPAAVLARARRDPVPECRDAGALGDVVAALMARDPRDRPNAQDAAEMLAGLTGSPLPARAARRRPRRRLLGTGAIAIVGAVVAGLLVWSPWSSGDGAGATDKAVVLRPVLGDPRTADPCALTDPVALGRFGAVRVERDHGPFSRCDTHIDVGTGDDVTLTVQLLPPASTERLPDGVPVYVSVPDTTEGCRVTLELTDLNRAVIHATAGPPQPRPELCPLVDVAATSAVEAMRTGEIPRRTAPFAPGSLADVDACSLLTPADLAGTVGIDAIGPSPGIGNWTCTWKRATNALRIRVVLERSDPVGPVDAETTRIGGRLAVVERGRFGPDSCAFSVPYRQFTDDRGRPYEEQMTLVVDGAAPVRDGLCELAAGAAPAAAARLPA